MNYVGPPIIRSSSSQAPRARICYVWRRLQSRCRTWERRIAIGDYGGDLVECDGENYRRQEVGTREDGALKPKHSAPLLSGDRSPRQLAQPSVLSLNKMFKSQMSAVEGGYNPFVPSTVLEVVEPPDAIIVLVKDSVSRVSGTAADSKALTEIYSTQYSRRRGEVDNGGRRSVDAGGSGRTRGGKQAKALQVQGGEPVRTSMYPQWSNRNLSPNTPSAPSPVSSPFLVSCLTSFSSPAPSLASVFSSSV